MMTQIEQAQKVQQRLQLIIGSQTIELLRLETLVEALQEEINHRKSLTEDTA